MKKKMYCLIDFTQKNKKIKLRFNYKHFVLSMASETGLPASPVGCNAFKREVLSELKRLHARYSIQSRRVVADTCLPAMFLAQESEEGLREDLRRFVPFVASDINRDSNVAGGRDCVLEVDDDLFADGTAVFAEGGDADHESTTGSCADQSSPMMYTGPEPSCRDLPLWVFPAFEVFSNRPVVLPSGFYVRQTPLDFSNYVSESRNKRQCKLLWWPNLYMLKMGEHYRPLFGRYLRGTREEQRNWIYFELIFSSYCIVFRNEMLDMPHVLFQPLFVPSPKQDSNAWARRVTDFGVGFNTVPPVPPGIYIPFGRLSGSWSINKIKSDTPSGELSSKLGPEHPVLQGKSVFTLPESGIGPSYQDGGVGFMMYRYNASKLGFFDEAEHFGQPIVLFARCAFGQLALASIEEQRRAVYDSVKFALMNAPRASNGQPHVVLDGCHTGQTELDFGILHDIPAPAFEHAIAGVNGVNVREQTCLFLQKAFGAFRGNDIATRHQVDMYMRTYETFSNLKRHSHKRPRDESFVLEDGTALTSDAVHSIVSLVSKYETIVQQWHAIAGASKALFYLAPPDLSAFGDKPVAVFSFILRVRLNVDTKKTISSADAAAYQRILSDYGTRFMWDMMFWNPQLCVLSTQSETFMSLQQDKAPGVLGVNSAKFGVPAKSTSTSDSRRIRNPHPALKGFEVQTTSTAFPSKTPVHPPHLSAEQAALNPMLRLTLRGPLSPMGVPGTDVSVYRPYTKATATHFAGTCHAWPVIGGYIDRCIRTPSSPTFRWGFFKEQLSEEQCADAIGFLYAPHYNSVGGEIWNLDGRWRLSDFQPRKWSTAYGVSVNMMHRAMAYLLYPAFASEYNTPSTLRIWELKQRCEAVMHWMSRDGRVVRLVFGNRRRELRNDFATNTRNYVTFMGNRVPGAPIASVFLSAFNAFEHNLIVGETARRWDRKSFGGSGRDSVASSAVSDDVFMDADVIYEDVTTSMMFGDETGIRAGAGSEVTAAIDSDQEDEYNEDDDCILGDDDGCDQVTNDADAAPSYDAPGTLTSMFLGSVGSAAFNLGSVLKTSQTCVPSTAHLLGNFFAMP